MLVRALQSFALVLKNLNWGKTIQILLLSGVAILLLLVSKYKPTYEDLFSSSIRDKKGLEAQTVKSVLELHAISVSCYVYEPDQPPYYKRKLVCYSDCGSKKAEELISTTKEQYLYMFPLTAKDFAEKGYSKVTVGSGHANSEYLAAYHLGVEYIFPVTFQGITIGEVSYVFDSEVFSKELIKELYYHTLKCKIYYR